MLARENPFSTSKVERILRFDPALNGTTWSDIESRWHSLEKRASLIGPHGAGKTTFLDAFAQRLDEEGETVYRLFLNTERRLISNTQWQDLAQSEGKVVLLDGEEQLSFLQRRRFYRLTAHANGVLASRHSKGRFPSLLDFKPTVETLAHCVRQLSPEHYSQLEPHFLTWWKLRNGNIREILLECYDFLATQ